MDNTDPVRALRIQQLNSATPEAAAARLGALLASPRLGVHTAPDPGCAIEHLPVGSVAYVLGGLRTRGFPLPDPVDYPEALRPFLRRAVRLARLEDVLGRRLWIKGAGHDKPFAPGLANRDDLDGRAGDLAVWASEPVSWLSEHRCYVCEGRLLWMSRYDPDGADDAPEPDPAVIAQMIGAYESSGGAPAGYAIDAGVLLNGETALVEVNDGYALGFRRRAGRWVSGPAGVPVPAAGNPGTRSGAVFRAPVRRLAAVTCRIISPPPEAPAMQRCHIGLRRGLAMLLAGAALSAAVTAAEVVSGVASVIDGDTVEVHGQRIRMHGIDAPESRQLCRKPDGSPWRCGQQAALALADRIGRGTVSCAGKDRDRYGRLVAVCSAGGRDLNRWMVAQGWAVAYRRYSTDYVAAETEARAAGRNIWSGQFDMPWDWRRGQRLVGEGAAGQAGRKAAVGAQPGCAIKGNIGSSGKRIYHVPGGRWYGQTRIDQSKGERWFCSEAEARAAGWTRSAQ